MSKIFNQTQEKERTWVHNRPSISSEFNLINATPLIFEAGEKINELFLKTFVLDNQISILGFYLSL